MDSFSSGFSLGGLATGFDSNALISALLDVERLPSLRIGAERTRLSDESRFFDQINERLDTLLDRLKDVSSRSGLESNVATSSDDTAVRVETDGSVSDGTHRITVEQLARAGSQATKGFASADDPIGTGLVSISSGGENFDLTLDSTASLNDIAAAIEESGAPVSVAVIDTGSGATPFRLVLTANETGVAKDFTVDFAGAPALGAALGITSLQSAQDARFHIDGLSISRSGNQVDDLITGLRLDLRRATSPGEEILITVGPDDEQLKDKVRAFLDAYNDTAQLLGSRFQTDEDGATTSVLFGDSGIRALQSRLRDATTGSTFSGETFESLAELGIRTDSTGRLTLDETRFDEALASDRDGLIALFADETSGIAGRLEDAVQEVLAPGDGLLATRRDGIERRDRVLGQRLEVLDRRLLVVEQRLIDRFAALERLVSDLNSQGAALGGL